MSQSEHTPKPWKPVRSLTCGHLRAEHNYRKDPREEWTDADLRLIAAAPELLEACEAFIAADNQCGASLAFVMAQEAVKKAMFDEPN
jgi:hypothetical protein